MGSGAVTKDSEVAMEERLVQYFGRKDDAYTLRMNGSEQSVIVRSPAEHRLSRYMLAPEVKDYSRFVMCPMPGSLISVGE